jgi:hypothetical protein
VCKYLMLFVLHDYWVTSLKSAQFSFSSGLLQLTFVEVLSCRVRWLTCFNLLGFGVFFTLLIKEVCVNVRVLVLVWLLLVGLSECGALQV